MENKTLEPKLTRKERRSDAIKVNLRKSHPTLYRGIMWFAIFALAMAWNYFFRKPTFTPYGIPKEVIGGTFLFLGMTLVILLNVFRNLRLVRIVMALSSGFVLFWGISNTQQAFANTASFALPITLIYVAGRLMTDLIESPVNPMTRRKE